MLALDPHGRCVFYRHERCAVHATLGPRSLPSACQHFPRVCLIDPRGTFVTLSHYCPTAAALLFDDQQAGVTVVEGPRALAGAVPLEGLDAREALPPLLSPRMLMDLDSYGAWECHMVETLTTLAPRRALHQLHADVGALESWRPTAGALIDAVRGLAGQLPSTRMEAGDNRPLHTRDDGSRTDLFNVVRGVVPAPLRWPDAPPDLDVVWRDLVAPLWSSFGGVVGRYLASRAFASWVAYQGTGLRAVVRSVEASLAVLEVEVAREAAKSARLLDAASLRHAMRSSDLLLVHYIDPQAFADALSSVEWALASMSS